MVQEMGPDEVVRRLLQNEGDSEGLPELLLEAIFRGFPVRNLELLLRHPLRAVVLDAGWVLSELGKQGAELVDLSVELLSHPLDEIRADAISNLLANSDSCSPEGAWAIVSRYSGETPRIREEIVNYLARVPLVLLRDAISPRGEKEAASHTFGFRLHLAPAVGAPILDALRSTDEVIRAYAVAATKRLEIFVTAAWRAAARSDDTTVREFAKAWLSP